jgi:hypothetical protein
VVRLTDDGLVLEANWLNMTAPLGPSRLWFFLGMGRSGRMSSAGFSFPLAEKDVRHL